MAGRGGPATAANGADVTRIALTTKAPYQPEGNPHAYPPPRGFQPVFTYNLTELERCYNWSPAAS